MKFDKRMVLVVVAAFALAFFVAQGGDSPIPNPFVPAKPERPFLKFVAKVAKTFLWAAVFLEERPTYPQYHDQAAIGPDGVQLLNHAEGW